MKAELFEKALNKIPDIVANIVAWNAPAPVRLYSLVVTYYSSNGVLTHSNRFCVDEDDLIDAVQRANKQWDCTIDEVSDTQVVIRRVSTSGNYVVATYKPTESSGVIMPANN